MQTAGAQSTLARLTRTDMEHTTMDGNALRTIFTETLDAAYYMNMNAHAPYLHTLWQVAPVTAEDDDRAEHARRALGTHLRHQLQCPTFIGSPLGGPGLYQNDPRQIFVRYDTSPRMLHVLAHEAAHAFHRDEGIPRDTEPTADYARKEVRSELIATLVSRAYGVNPGNVATAYIACWQERADRLPRPEEVIEPARYFIDAIKREMESSHA